MGIVVRKSSPVVVRPSEPVETTSTMPLSSFDEGLERVPATLLLMFEHPIHDPADTVKRALSRALVYYHPFAGRIAAGAGADADGGKLHIRCNGEGATFVSAHASCGVAEVIGLDRSAAARTLLDDLAVYYPDNCCRAGDPLLLVQVTEFSCGGFVLGATVNHAVADAAGLAQFLNAIGELARGMASPSVAPVRWDGSLPSRPPPVVSTRELVTDLGLLDDYACFDITIPSASIGRIKAQYARRFDGARPCTSFEVASAVLWRCRTRAVMSDPETPALFMFGGNVRKYVGAMEGYYGNCATSQLVFATSGTVANGDIVDLVKMIKQSKEKIPDQFEKNQGNNNHPPKPMHHQLLRYNMLVVSSLRNLGFEEVDFGSGTAARLANYAQEKVPFPACLMSPHKGKDGVNMLTTMVKKEHVDSFIAELARFTEYYEYYSTHSKL
jgi:hypothetical protein